MSFAQNIALQVKRFACDRCHGQKLRCPRPVDGDLHEPCVRCCKAGTPCGISTPPRRGRPNKSRKLNTGQRAPSHTSSSESRSMSKRKSSNTRMSSESGSEEDQPGVTTNVLLDQTSRCSSAIPSSSDTFLASRTTNLNGAAESANPIATNDFLQYLDFDFDFADAMDTGIYNDNINRVGTKCPTETLHEVENPSVTAFTNTARPNGYAFSTEGDIPERTPYDALPVDSAFNRFDEFRTCCLGQNDACTTPPQTVPLQISSTRMAQSPIPRSTSVRNPCAEEYPSAQARSSISALANTRKSTPDSAIPYHSPPPPRYSSSEYIDCQVSERGSLASLLEIQQRIYDCSQKIMQPNPSHQDNTSALGRFFCATDRFIAHISRDHTLPPSSTLSPASRCSTLSSRAGSSSTYTLPPKSSISPLDCKETSDNCPPCPTLPSDTVFYLIMACHARILSAYDAIISVDPSTTVMPSENPQKSTTGECSFSLGSFAVRPGTSLESLLHLQIILHQLEHLNSALCHCMMTDTSSSSGLSSRSGLSKSGTSSPWAQSSSSLQDFAVQLIEQQGRVLKGKIVARIMNAQGTLRNAVHQN